MSFTNPTGTPGSPSTGDELMTVAEIAATLRLNQQTIRTGLTKAGCQRSGSDGACGSNAQTSSSC